MEATIKLYPEIEEVLTDPLLECYFRPLLTCNCERNVKNYKIHLLCFDGVFPDENRVVKYSEGGLFGFQYNNGVYKFLGDIKTLEHYDKIPVLYECLKADVIQHKDEYVDNKVPFSKYYNRLKGLIKKDFAFDTIDFYTEAFYSYEFTKYYYEKTGIHKHISVLTENYGENDDDFLLEENDARNMLEEFFLNIQWNLKNNYDGFNIDMFCCAAECYRFMSLLGSFTIFGLLDEKNDIVYNLVYGS